MHQCIKFEHLKMRVIQKIVPLVFAIGCSTPEPEPIIEQPMPRTPKVHNEVHLRIEEPLVMREHVTTIEGTPSRKHNVILAAMAISGYTIKPGESFSFNKVVGPRTRERGYRKAPQFLKGRKVDGYGGGICQVSSTLYAAAMASKLEVTRRKSHSMPVGYIERGFDATVNYGSHDLVIKNPYDVPVTISTSVIGDELTVGIQGLLADFDVQYQYSTLHLVPFKVVEEVDPTVSERTKLQNGKVGAPGVGVWNYRRNNETFKSVRVVSNYGPRPEIWLIPPPKEDAATDTEAPEPPPIQSGERHPL